MIMTVPGAVNTHGLVTSHVNPSGFTIPCTYSNQSKEADRSPLRLFPNSMNNGEPSGQLNDAGNRTITFLSFPKGVCMKAAEQSSVHPCAFEYPPMPKAILMDSALGVGLEIPRLFAFPPPEARSLTTILARTPSSPSITFSVVTQRHGMIRIPYSSAFAVASACLSGFPARTLSRFPTSVSIPAKVRLPSKVFDVESSTA